MFDYCSTMERNIAKALVRRALEQGYSISVDDGEEVTLRKSINETTIFEAMNSTDSDTLKFYKNGLYIGWIWLVWGNEEDLISDCSASDEIEKLAGM